MHIARKVSKRCVQRRPTLAQRCHALGHEGRGRIYCIHRHPETENADRNAAHAHPAGETGGTVWSVCASMKTRGRSSTPGCDCEHEIVLAFDARSVLCECAVTPVCA